MQFNELKAQRDKLKAAQKLMDEVADAILDDQTTSKDKRTNVVNAIDQAYYKVSDIFGMLHLLKTKEN